MVEVMLVSLKIKILMATEHLLGRTGISTLVNTKKTNERGMELLYGLRVRNMLVILKTIKNMGWANIYLQIKKNTLVSGKIIKRMVKEL